MLRKLTRVLRPGGIVAFQQFDISGARSFPASPAIMPGMDRLLPLLVKLEIATEAQVVIDTLRDRIQQEILAADGIAISPSLISGWARLN